MSTPDRIYCAARQIKVMGLKRSPPTPMVMRESEICAAYVGLSPGVYPITADFLGDGVPVTGPAASVGLTTLTVTSAPPVPTNPDLLITSAASVTFGTSVTYSFDYFDSPPGYLFR